MSVVWLFALLIPVIISIPIIMLSKRRDAWHRKWYPEQYRK